MTTPIQHTVKARNLRNGREEIWEALLGENDEWGAERLEDASTSWMLIHMPTGIAVWRFGSLDSCRAAINTGYAWICLRDQLEAGTTERQRAETREKAQAFLEMLDASGLVPRE